MNKSYYFAELATSYDAEIQDLLNDSEGNSAIQGRLKEKRQELASLLPMIEFCPEMVVPVFYDGFSFSNPKAMAALLMCEPDNDDFPEWAALSSLVSVAPRLNPYLESVLAEAGGDRFMVTAACLEFIRQFDAASSASSDDSSAGEEGSDDEDRDGDDQDLAEAGDDWLGQQGFDSLKS